VLQYKQLINCLVLDMQRIEAAVVPLRLFACIDNCGTIVSFDF